MALPVYTREPFRCHGALQTIWIWKYYALVVGALMILLMITSDVEHGISRSSWGQGMVLDVWPSWSVKPGEYDILIVGAGLSGTVLADLYARKHGKRVLVLDRRPHIGGNCFDEADEETGILTNKYGAHLFHTNKQDVWEYVHRFSSWIPYEHRVMGHVDGRLVPIPVNIDTVNSLFGAGLNSTEAMARWLAAERNTSGMPEVPGNAMNAYNSREVGVGRVGQRLYDKLFREYTKKQWNVFPEAIGPEVLSRIPVRTDWDDRYFPNDQYQAVPAAGYTEWFRAALEHPSITVVTGVDYFSAEMAQVRAHRFAKTFFTGQIDQFFRNKGSTLEPLQYRSIRFERVVVDEPSVIQSTFVVNYPQIRDGSFTRAAEYKHMYHQAQDSPRSILIREYSTDIEEDQEPYYPFPTQANQVQFEKYEELAKQEERENNVHFVGRLANYKYFNMDDAIRNSLELYKRLEGRRLLDKALLEGRARMRGDDAAVVHVVIALGSPAASSLLSWLPNLTATLCKIRPGETYWSPGFKWFVYSSDSSDGGDKVTAARLTRQLVDVLESNGCPPARPGESFFLRQVNPKPAALRWLNYFVQHSFSFGDVNLFLDAVRAAPEEAVIAKRA